MPEPTSDRTAVDHPLETKQEWHAPQLTVLGDLRTLTEAGAMGPPDAGNSAIS
jgi:hypothetical protein